MHLNLEVLTYVSWISALKCLSGRVLDSGSRVCGFEPHRRKCVVSLIKTLYPLLSTGSTQEDPSRHDGKIVDCDVKNQDKQIGTLILSIYNI